MTSANHPRLLLDSLADVLAELAIDVEGLGEQLCADPQVVAQHFGQLQGLDLIGQHLRHVADILGSDKPEESVAEIRLEALRVRLLCHIDPALPCQQEPTDLWR